MTQTHSTQSRPKSFHPLVHLLNVAPWSLLFFLNCTQSPHSTTPRIPKPQDTGVVYNTSKSFPHHFIVQNYQQNEECSVYSNDGTFIKRFPGEFCNFTTTGNYIAKVNDSLVFYDAQAEVQWKQKLNIHHDIFVDDTFKKIAVINSKTQTKNSSTIEVDFVTVFDFSGKKLYEWSSSDDLKKIEKILNKKISPEKKPEDPKKKILLKVNSIQILPNNKLAVLDSRFKQGNLLINISNIPLSIIVDPETHKIVWSHLFFSEKKYDGVHSPRLLENGTLIYLKNWTPTTKTEKDHLQLLAHPSVIKVENKFYMKIFFDKGTDISEISRSEIQIMNPVSQNVVWSYTTPLASVTFFSPYFGNIQHLNNGNILVTHITHGGAAFELDSKGQIVWEWVNPLKMSNGLPMNVYRVIKIEQSLLQPFLDKVF